MSLRIRTEVMRQVKKCTQSHKVRHPRCVYNRLDWSVYTCLTQLYGGRDMYNLLHKVVLYVIKYTSLYHHIVVLDKSTHSNPV